MGECVPRKQAYGWGDAQNPSGKKREHILDFFGSQTVQLVNQFINTPVG
jgi:hypothetical protein